MDTQLHSIDMLRKKALCFLESAAVPSQKIVFMFTNINPKALRIRKDPPTRGRAPAVHKGGRGQRTKTLVF